MRRFSQYNTKQRETKILKISIYFEFYNKKIVFIKFILLKLLILIYNID